MAELPRDWMAQAACKGFNTKLFFVHVGRQPTLSGLAVELCGMCPVRLPCYCYALVRDEYGIWGGTTHEERARIRAFAGKVQTEIWTQIVSDYGREMDGRI